jgi:four helix bundle protein
VTTLAEQLEAWESAPPADVYGDPIWRLPAFRIARFLSEIAGHDVIALIRDGAPSGKINQLERSVPSIAANIAEGYSRFSGKERARYYEIALGSARESREWYRDLRSWLGASEALERGMLLTRIIKILTVAIPRERAGESERRIRNALDSSPKEAAPAPAPAPAPATSTRTSNPQQATSE